MEQLNRFGIIIPCLAKYFLDVGALVSLKVTTKTSFRDKNYFENLDFQGNFLKQQRRSATKKIKVSTIDLVLSYLVQVHFF